MAATGEWQDDAGPSTLRDAAVDAAGVLIIALRWHLPRARWQAVEEALDELAAAISAADVAAMRAATAELIAVGPLRVTRVGDVPEVPAPETAQDKLNKLVHDLDSVAPGFGDPTGRFTGSGGHGDADRPGAR